MKHKITKLNELQIELLIALGSSIIFALCAVVGIFFNQPGWLIGVAIGTVVELLYIFLVNKSSDLALNEKKTGLYLLTYFGRMILFVGVFATLVVLQYSAEIKVFYYSAWGMLIAFFPSTLITVITETKARKE